MHGPEILYDAVSDVVESGVQWRSNFQIGSRAKALSRNCLTIVAKPLTQFNNIKQWPQHVKMIPFKNWLQNNNPFTLTR